MSESTLVKIPHCYSHYWKSHVAAHLISQLISELVLIHRAESPFDTSRRSSPLRTKGMLIRRSACISMGEGMPDIGIICDSS